MDLPSSRVSLEVKRFQVSACDWVTYNGKTITTYTVVGAWATHWFQIVTKWVLNSITWIQYNVHTKSILLRFGMLVTLA